MAWLTFISVLSLVLVFRVFSLCQAKEIHLLQPREPKLTLLHFILIYQMAFFDCPQAVQLAQTVFFPQKELKMHPGTRVVH